MRIGGCTLFTPSAGVRDPPQHRAMGLGHLHGWSRSCASLKEQNLGWPCRMEGIRWKLSGAILGWEEPENHHGGSWD